MEDDDTVPAFELDINSLEDSEPTSPDMAVSLFSDDVLALDSQALSAPEVPAALTPETPSDEVGLSSSDVFALETLAIPNVFSRPAGNASGSLQGASDAARQPPTVPAPLPIPPSSLEVDFPADEMLAFPTPDNTPSSGHLTIALEDKHEPEPPVTLNISSLLMDTLELESPLQSSPASQAQPGPGVVQPPTEDELLLDLENLVFDDDDDDKV